MSAWRALDFSLKPELRFRSRAALLLNAPAVIADNPKPGKACFLKRLQEPPDLPARKRGLRK